MRQHAQAQDLRCYCIRKEQHIYCSYNSGNIYRPNQVGSIAIVNNPLGVTFKAPAACQGMYVYYLSTYTDTRLRL